MRVTASYFVLSALLWALAAGGVQAEERIDLEGTAIVGNRELPKVLYIVPWKKSELPEVAEPSLESIVNEALSPIERDAFRRQINFHQQIVERNAQPPAAAK